MTVLELESLLARLATVRLGVIGDFCLDAYWELDPSAAETSLETGLVTRPVCRQRYSPGGAGNVAQNLAAMGVGQVSAYGVVGPDPFGERLRALLRGLAIRDRLLVQPGDWATHTFIKPVEAGDEDRRIDFGNFNELADAVSEALLGHLAEDLATLDAVIVNQQVYRGVHRSARFQQGLQALIEEHAGTRFLLDSRELCRRYAGTTRKLNACEARRLTGGRHDPRDTIALAEVSAAARQLADEWQRPLFVTRGEHGCLVVDGARVEIVPALRVGGPVDTVGAGDSMLAGIAAALAAGCDDLAAAEFGTLIAGVTVQKPLQTGTATPAELRLAAASAVYRPPES